MKGTEEKQFKTDICDCFTNVESCAISWCVPGLAAYLIAREINQDELLWGIIGCWAEPIGAIFLRKLIREKNDIPVSDF